MHHVGCHSLLAYIWTELPTHLLDLDQNDLKERLQELNSILQELRDINPNHPGILTSHNWTLQLLAQMPSNQHVIEQWKAETRSGLTGSKINKTDLQKFFRDILVAAIEANHFPALRMICGAGALSCDDGDQILSAILEAATKTNNSAILEFIGDRRKAINPTCSAALKDTFRGSLETACRNGYVAVTRWFLERGAISGTKDQGCTAIYLAVNAGHESVVKLLLDSGISPHHKIDNARSLLWIAAENGHEKVVRVLLKFGADPNSPDDQERTPLVVALDAGHEAIVKILWPLRIENLAMSNARPRLQFLVPMRRNPNFVGRADVLKPLEDALESQVTRIALVGLGGSGKTQTVTEFSYRMFEAQIVSTVFWMNASSDDSFLRDHEYISRRVQWQLEPKDPSKVQLEQFYRQLSFESGNKIIIWDNVDHPSDLISFAGSLPSTKNTYIVITSLNAVFSRKFAQDTGCIGLPVLSTSESVAFLEGIIKTKITDDMLPTIDDQFGGLPLAIAHAGSYMWRHRISPLEYKEILDKARKDFSDSNDYDVSISHPIEISLDHLESEDVLALEILYFMSILDANHIPIYLLLNRSSDLRSRISMEDLNRSIESLLSYSLVHFTQGQTCLDLHRLVQDVIRRRLYRKGNIAAWENAALKAVSYEFPQGSFEEWEKCGELLPHALVVLECDVVKDNENSLHRYGLLRNAGTYTMNVGRYPLAEKLLQEAYIVSMKQFGLDSINSRSVATLLAHLFLLTGRLEEAEQLEAQVLQTSSKVLGVKHPNTLDSMRNLASIWNSQGKYEEAEEMHRQVLDSMARVLGTEHPSTLTSMNDLAVVFSRQCKHKEAEEMHRQVLESMKRVLGEEHPSTLTSINDLAVVFSRQCKYKEAEEMYRQVIVSMIRVLGEKHPSTLTGINNLAVVLSRQGKYEEAKEIHRQLLALRERVVRTDE